MADAKICVVAACLLLAGVATMARADTHTSITDGNWNVPGTWDVGVPSPGDSVVVKHNVIVVTDVGSVANVTITDTLTVASGGDLTVTVAVAGDGTAGSLFRVTGGTATIDNLNQDTLNYVSLVMVDGGVLNITGVHTLHNLDKRCYVYNGTVNYQGNPYGLRFRNPKVDPTPAGGWFATGGAVNFSRSIYAEARANFDASGSAVIRFVGSESSLVVLVDTAGTGMNSQHRRAIWNFNELVLAKTGSPAPPVYFTACVTTGYNNAVICTVKVARPFVVPAGQTVYLNGKFSLALVPATGGYLFEGGVTNNGQILQTTQFTGGQITTQNRVFVTGDVTNNGIIYGQVQTNHWYVSGNFFNNESLYRAQSSTDSVFGDIINEGAIAIERSNLKAVGKLENRAGARITNPAFGGGIVAYGGFDNHGDVILTGTAGATVYGTFDNHGSYSMTGGAHNFNGAFVNETGATFTRTAAGNIFFNGDFTNDGSADWGTVSNYVTFGPINAAGHNVTAVVRGEAIFKRLFLTKYAIDDTLLLETDLTVTDDVTEALGIKKGTLVTNGYNLSVNAGPAASVSTSGLGVGQTGNLSITGNSTVDVNILDQNSGKIRYVVVAGNPTVNIYGQHTLFCQNRIFAMSGGTVNYLSTGRGLLLDGNNPPVADDCGFVTTGGTVNVSGFIEGDQNSRLKASGDAAVKFVGDVDGGVLFHNLNAGPVVPGEWQLNDLRIEKTGGAVVACSTLVPGDLFAPSILTASQLTIGPGASLWLGGKFDPSTPGYHVGDVANNGTLVVLSSANHSNNDLYVSGDWTGAGPQSTVPVVFEGTDANTVALTSGSFYDLTVDKATGSLALGSDLTVEHALAVASGTFAVGEHQLTMGTGSGAGSVTVADGATFTAVGSGVDADALVTSGAELLPYSFAVNSGGTIAARHAGFRWMDANGIQIAAGATIDPTDGFSECAFDHGDLGGPMLRIANDQDLTISKVSFYATDGSNIAKEEPATVGRITVFRGTGTRWGEDYDLDPLGLIDWTVAHDVGVSAILRPAGTVSQYSVVYPKMTVVNYGDMAETFMARCIITDDADGEVFNQAEEVTDLGVGETRELQFATHSWTATPQGGFNVRCTTELAGDTDGTNDRHAQDFTVGYPGGWTEAEPMPHTAADKPVKDGGWLALHPGAADDGPVFYVAKGNKTTDFFRYHPVEDSWVTLAPIPSMEGTKNKPPSKGCVGASDGENFLYMTKGNNTLGFWRYDVAVDSWRVLPDVPVGAPNKRVKGGTDIVYVPGTGDTGWVYLLKGYKTEFYRFNTATQAWDTTLPTAPAGGGKEKYDKGSFLVYDPAGYIYAHQAKYYDKVLGFHYMFRYDIQAGRWADTLRGLPLPGWHGGRPGKNKKSKDGAAGDWFADGFHALKGGNTQQFFRYFSDGDSWRELDTMPAFGSTLKKKYVKQGGDLAGLGNGTFFALKGNKTFELWRYVANGELRTPNSELSRTGVMAETFDVRRSSFVVSPNPIASGFATLRLGLPKAGPVVVTLFDISGRAVLRQAAVCNLQSAIAMDLRKVPAGVYLVRLDSDGRSQTQKLVVSR